MRALSTPLVALALAAIASSASAAPKVAVSSLPSIALTPAKNPKRVASVAGVVVGKAPAYKGATYVNVDAAVSQGYCFVSRDYTLRL